MISEAPVSEPAPPPADAAEPAIVDDSAQPTMANAGAADVAESTAVLGDSPVEEVPPAFLGLRPGDQRFIGAMLILSLVLMGGQWVRLSGWGLREVEIERQPARALEYRVDINSATWVEWSQLEGIGETLAMRIVEDRQQNGPFADIDDVLRVPGIGPKKLEAIRRWLTVKEAKQAEE